MCLDKMISIIALFAVSSAGMAVAGSPASPELAQRFKEVVQPALETYCFACHGKDKQKAKLDLRPYTTPEAVAGGYRGWELVIDRLKSNEMPPEDADEHLPAKLRQEILDWSAAMRRDEAQRHAGDPGPVPARRLSNAEYDHTIRDLTGVDIRPAREFPIDPANESGFDNSGESLTMPPALLTKHLAAARQVTEHLVLKPEGFEFAPHPVITETDRDKFCVQRIMEFYQRQPLDYADYFMAAWHFKLRAATGNMAASMEEIAAADKVSAGYLATVWSALTDGQDMAGPMKALRAMWNALPAMVPEGKDAARAGCERMRDFVIDLRKKLVPEVGNLAVRGMAAGSQPLVLWKNRGMASNHTRYDPGALHFQTGPLPDLVEDPLMIPEDPSARAPVEAAVARFCRVFPDAFYVPERVLVFLKEDKESRGRLLSAGFHLMTGYFRDDTPLSELILDEPARRELDRLWEEFHFITGDAVRQFKDFIFFERAEPPRFMEGREFDFARSEDKDATSEAKITRLAEAYLTKARRNGAAGPALTAIEDFFKNSSAAIRHVEQAMLAAEPSHLEALTVFAERAWRRPLSGAEREDLLSFYNTLRKLNGLDHEDAVRDTVVRILLSPLFCYRIDPDATNHPRDEAPALSSKEWKANPLSSYALASRLSYFLWASMPDAALLDQAQAGDLTEKTVLLAHVRRMLQDDRIRGLATEFGGNWLDFRRFEEHNAVDRGRFPDFTNELRAAMFEEPVRFFIELVREDRPVLDFLFAGYTFVNSVLAKHYGMPDPHAPPSGWVRIDDAGQYERGGLLPMAVFLTKNAPGLRTSPVKRGNWVVRYLLGERIPPPPATVPELPSDEAKTGDLTLREALASHRADKNCAGCHARFDAYGLVFEGFGPVGERRDRDLAGRPVDARALFPDGSEGTGLHGLHHNIRAHRQQDFIGNLCRKLLVYALGRSLLISDDDLLAGMRAKLEANGYQFSSLVETIVTSPQFLTFRKYHTPTK